MQVLRARHRLGLWWLGAFFVGREVFLAALGAQAPRRRGMLRRTVRSLRWSTAAVL